MEELLRKLEETLVVELDISEIVKEGRVHPRERLDERAVERYAEVLREGGELDPIAVCKLDGRLYLADGWHRIAAYERAGIPRAKAKIVEVSSLREVLWLAVRLNSRHGVQLDPRVAARKMFLEGMSVEEIASALGYHPNHVRRLIADVRRELRKELSLIHI